MSLHDARDRTLAWTLPLLVLMCAGIAWVAGTGEPGVRMMIRATAYGVIFAGAVRPGHAAVGWGLVWVAVSFLAAYGSRAARQPLVYGPVVALLLLSLALRVVAPLVHPVPPPKEDLAA